MTMAEILVSGGVAAVLAAVIGGGLSAFGIQLPLIANLRRQAAMFVTGLALIVIGVVLGRSNVTPVVTISGATLIDFRPHLGSGQLEYTLVTTNISVHNAAKSLSSVVWSDSTGELQLDGARIPFRAFKFTELPEVSPDPAKAREQWLGINPTLAHPVTLGPGATETHEVMFMPDNTGSGRYRWQEFVGAVFGRGQIRPKFVARVELRTNDGSRFSLMLECVAQLRENVDNITANRQNLSEPIQMTAECMR